jgi:hypothetical protein
LITTAISDRDRANCGRKETEILEEAAIHKIAKIIHPDIF